MKNTHIAVGAMAIALAFAPLAKLQAASLLTPDSRLEVGGLAEVVKAKVGKSKLGKKKHMRKHARRKGARPGCAPGGPLRREHVLERQGAQVHGRPRQGLTCDPSRRAGGKPLNAA